MFKEQKGITLVALVITIIVLLILAGVSISLVMGDNGILTQATGAVKANQIATVREKIETSFAAVDVAYYAEWTSNQNVTRAKVYQDKLAAELLANGLTDVTIGSFTPDANGGFIAEDSSIKYDGTEYVISRVTVDGKTGALNMDNPVEKTATTGNVVDNTAGI